MRELPNAHLRGALCCPFVHSEVQCGWQILPLSYLESPYGQQTFRR